MSTSFLSEMWALATETPNEKRERLRQQGAVTRRQPRSATTQHPDDAGHSGLDKYAKKGKR